MELSDFYEHGIARGVLRFARSRPDWRIFGYGWMFRPLSDLEHWRGDGIIARIESSSDADRIAALGLCVVDVAGAYLRPGFRQVTNDDFLTGYKAFLHLRSCGFERFAFLGVSGTLWSSAREEGFLRGIPGKVPAFRRPLPWWEGAVEAQEDLAAFLSSLEAPTGLFACNDTAGLRAAELARRLGLAVPENLAILGVDNEDILCELSSPPLSSIMLDCEAIGFRAAQTLAAVLEGEPPSTAMTGDAPSSADGAAGGAAGGGAVGASFGKWSADLAAERVPGRGASGPPGGTRIAIAPREVVERESTMIYACSDPLVSKAATFIRSRAHEGIDEGDVLAVVPSSRRALETRFRAAMGRSLHEEIVRVRLTRARRFLRETELTLEEVAAESGFGGLQRFHAAFRAAEGISPGQWRRFNSVTKIIAI
jgi:LacI family transcriptional regulator